MQDDLLCLLDCQYENTTPLCYDNCAANASNVKMAVVTNCVKNHCSAQCSGLSGS